MNLEKAKQIVEGYKNAENNYLEAKKIIKKAELEAEEKKRLDELRESLKVKPICTKEEFLTEVYFIIDNFSENIKQKIEKSVTDKILENPEYHKNGLTELFRVLSRDFNLR